MKRRYTKECARSRRGDPPPGSPRGYRGGRSSASGRDAGSFGETVDLLERMPLSYLHVFTFGVGNTAAAPCGTRSNPGNYHRATLRRSPRKRRLSTSHSCEILGCCSNRPPAGRHVRPYDQPHPRRGSGGRRPDQPDRPGYDHRSPDELERSSPGCRRRSPECAMSIKEHNALSTIRPDSSRRRHRLVGGDNTATGQPVRPGTPHFRWTTGGPAPTPGTERRQEQEMAATVAEVGLASSIRCCPGWGTLRGDTAENISPAPTASSARPRAVDSTPADAR